MAREFTLFIYGGVAFLLTFHVASNLYAEERRGHRSASYAKHASLATGEDMSNFVAAMDPGNTRLELQQEQKLFFTLKRDSSEGAFGSSRKALSRVGAVVERPADRVPSKLDNTGPRYHTAMTCDSSGYSKWQSRVMYYFYKKWQKAPGGSSMGDFTRVLHTGVGDELMDQIPTYIVDPLPDSQLMGYVVLNRPYAFLQWISQAQFEEEYVFMAEPDHLITRPIPNLAVGDMPAAFPFFYMNPKEHKDILGKYYSGPVGDIDPVGNSPVILKRDQLKKIAPLWHNMSMAMKQDKEADKAFGWVLEMYAYTTAAAVVGVRHNLFRNWMIQPPWDKQVGSAYIIHYTYGCDFTLDGTQLPDKVGPWHFDKRDHERNLPKNITLPPKGSAQSVNQLISMLNEATASIPNWDTTVDD